MIRRVLLFIVGVAVFMGCKEDKIKKVDSSAKYPFIGETEIVFSSQEESAKLLGQSDVYTKGLSLFDIQAKTQDLSSSTEADYLKNAASEAKAWTEAEITGMMTNINAVATKIKALGLKLDLPKYIKLVKTSLHEEGDAGGYTRSDFIVLSSTASQNLFTHELFHIYTRANPSKRDELYKTINFEKCKEITLPAEYQAKRITNPDAPTLEHCLSVQIDGKQQDVVFVTYANRVYEGGSFFHYLKQSLLLVEGDASNKMAILNNEAPIYKDYNDASNLVELIGDNTNYNIHPEEILAEHFRCLVLNIDVPKYSFLDSMKEVLQK